jgi:hypothetical protein
MAGKRGTVDWRTETVNNSAKTVNESLRGWLRLRALGWPAQIVDAPRAQLQSITKNADQNMDHMMDVWESRANHQTRHRQCCRT